MTPKQALAKWVRLLRLQEWDVYLEVRPGENIDETETGANVSQIVADPLNRFATVTVCAGRRERIEGDIRHELLHLALTDLEVAAEQAADRLGFDAAAVFRGMIFDLVERTVLRLDRALEELTRCPPT